MTEKEDVVLKKTALDSIHIGLKAVMAPFAGFHMPIRYPAGELAEIKAVRTKAGLFDISHMGQIFVSGTAARSFLNFVVTRDLAPLKVGEAKYTLLCNNHGFPIDDLIIYLLSSKEDSSLEETVYDERFLVVANASNVEKVYKWFRGILKGYKDYLADWETLRVNNDSENFSLLALQGPYSEKILSEVTPYDEIPTKNYSCAYTYTAGRRVLVLRSGYTGEVGFEILFDNRYAEEIWNTLMEYGAEYGMLPCGLAARDVLRLEAGMPLYGHEISETHDPISAGLGRYVSFEKGNFVGRDALLKMPPQPTLHALVMPKGRVPRAGYAVWNDVDIIGTLTSAGYSPTLQKNIAMAYLCIPYKEGSTVFIEYGGQKLPATVTKLPFYKRAK